MDQSALVEEGASSRAWHSLRTIDLGETAVDAGLGLRFYMPGFIVRVDVAWSREGRGLNFNFGHIF